MLNPVKTHPISVPNTSRPALPFWHSFELLQVEKMIRKISKNENRGMNVMVARRTQTSAGAFMDSEAYPDHD